jgi:gluconolactonase
MIRRILFTAGTVLFAGLAAAAMPICGECRMEKYASCGGFLEGASVDAKGGLWVVDLLSGKVLEVGSDGRCTTRGNTGGQPNGAKFGSDGQLWITDKQLGLLKMDPQTGKVTPIVQSYRNERLRGLNDLAFDATGGVYFTEPYGSSALKPDGRLFYLPSGKDAKLQVVAGNLAFPNGIVVVPGRAKVYVGEYALKRITALPAVGSPDEFDVAHVFATTVGGVGPDGMLLMKDGTLLAANFDAGEIIGFDPLGHPIGSFRVPAGLRTTNLAIRGEWLYVTEGSSGEVWRVRLVP